MKKIILISTVLALFVGGCSTFSTNSSYTSGKCWLTFPDGSIRAKTYAGSCWK